MHTWARGRLGRSLTRGQLCHFYVSEAWLSWGDFAYIAYLLRRLAAYTHEHTSIVS